MDDPSGLCVLFSDIIPTPVYEDGLPSECTAQATVRRRPRSAVPNYGSMYCTSEAADG